MRSAVELRQRWLDTLPRMLTRPGMWAADGQAFDIVARGLLADLCFLDERDRDYDGVHAVLRGFGKLGVSGPFAALFGKDRSCVAEVASVFAEQFYRLGYLAVERLLDQTEWEHLVAQLHERFDGCDVRRSEVEAEFGPPSLVVEERVLCYAPLDSSGWILRGLLRGAPSGVPAQRATTRGGATTILWYVLARYDNRLAGRSTTAAASRARSSARASGAGAVTRRRCLPLLVAC